jgi:hypothetical protein
MKIAKAVIVMSAVIALAATVYAAKYKATITATDAGLANDGTAIKLNKIDTSCVTSNKSFLVFDDSVGANGAFETVVVNKGTNVASVLCTNLIITSVANTVTAVKTNFTEKVSTVVVSNSTLQGTVVVDVKTLISKTGTNKTAKGEGVLVDSGSPGFITVTISGAVK